MALQLETSILPCIHVIYCAELAVRVDKETIGERFHIRRHKTMTCDHSFNTII